MPPSEAWELSYTERMQYVDQLLKIRDAEREAMGGSKIMRARDIANRSD